jgi:flagellar basal-body rod modification protein FlgD
MSTIDGTTATGSTTSSSTATSGSRTTLGREDFYKIMIGELQNQDPYDPVDNQQYLDQLATLQNLDTLGRLSDGIGKLVLQGQLSSASALIGKEVSTSASNADGSKVSGKVEKVQVMDGAVSLILDGDKTVGIGDLVEIS